MENLIHFSRSNGTDVEPVCGDWFSPDWTTAPREVTCPDCMEWLATKAERESRGETFEAAAEDGP